MLVETEGLGFPNTKIVVSLKLYECPTITAGINAHRTDSLRHYFFLGKKIGYSLSPHLMSQAKFDDGANEQVRELARRLLRTVLRTPAGHADREKTIQGIAALFLWLTLNDRLNGPVLRETMLQSLQSHRLALVELESDSNKSYTASIGETSVRLSAEASLFTKDT